MIKILFVCHGNICRSPMAEFIMRDIVTKKGYSDQFIIASKAVSNEEIGNPVYPPALSKLREKGIAVFSHYASRITHDDYQKYDYIIGMDDSNMYYLNKFFAKHDKLYKLLSFTSNNRDVKDPWYTNDFDKSYDDIYEGCLGLCDYLEKNNKIY